MHYLMSFVRNGRPMTVPFIYDDDMYEFAVTLPAEEWRNATYYAVLGAETLKDVTDWWVDVIAYDPRQKTRA